MLVHFLFASVQAAQESIAGLLMSSQGVVAVVFVREAALVYKLRAAFSSPEFTSVRNQKRQAARLRRSAMWLAFSAAWMFVYVIITLALGFSGYTYTAAGWTTMWTIALLARWGISFGQIMLCRPQNRSKSTHPVTTTTSTVKSERSTSTIQSSFQANDSE